MKRVLRSRFRTDAAPVPAAPPAAAAPAPRPQGSAVMDPADVPVIVNSFNQLTYLRTMVEQLTALGRAHVMVIDQASTYPPLLAYLGEIERTVTVVRLRENHGPHWLFTSGFYDTLPPFFAYSDPDIAFPDHMPASFIADMMRAAEFLGATKIGLALDISRPAEMKHAGIVINGEQYTQESWEHQFWRHPLRLGELELYRAPVDTTVALYNRRAYDPHVRTYREQNIFDCMDTPDSYRLGGLYTATHTPWMTYDPIPQEELDYYCATRANVHDY